MEVGPNYERFDDYEGPYYYHLILWILPKLSPGKRTFYFQHYYIVIHKPTNNDIHNLQNSKLS
jgi:hypothetical protein